MSFMTAQERYTFLTGIKRLKGTDRIKPEFADYVLTEEEEVFIQDFAMQKLDDLLSDPEIMAAFHRCVAGTQ